MKVQFANPAIWLSSNWDLEEMTIRFEKAELPIDINEDGIQTDRKEVPWKASVPIDVRVSGRLLMKESWLQFWKAYAPILVSPPPKLTEERA